MTPVAFRFVSQVLSARKLSDVSWRDAKIVQKTFLLSPRHCLKVFPRALTGDWEISFGEHVARSGLEGYMLVPVVNFNWGFIEEGEQEDSVTPFKFGRSVVDNFLTVSHANSIFIGREEWYFKIKPMRLFSLPVLIPCVDFSWTAMSPEIGISYLAQSIPVEAIWQTLENVSHRNQRRLNMMDPITEQWEILQPVVSIGVKLFAPLLFFAISFPRIYHGASTTTLLNWETGTPQWAPARPLPSLPLQTITASFPSPRIFREPSFVSLQNAVPIYSVEVSGPPTIVLKLVNFQARVNNQNYSYLSVAVHGVKDFEELESRIGNYIIVRRGYRWPDGRTQLDELLRTQFEELRYDIGSRNSQATLTGYYAANQSSDRLRKLTGISYMSVSGRKLRVRCNIDTFLRPGGVVEAMGSTFTVGEISYSVSGTEAVMEVEEE